MPPADLTNEVAAEKNQVVEFHILIQTFQQIELELEYIYDTWTIFQKYVVQISVNLQYCKLFTATQQQAKNNKLIFA